MGQRTRSVVALAALSAALAAMVPGVLDAPDTAVKPVVPMASASVEIPAASATVASHVAPRAATARDAEPEIAQVAAASGVKPSKLRVPMGCERLVSPLVRSAAASQLGRCVT